MSWKSFIETDGENHEILLEHVRLSMAERSSVRRVSVASGTQSNLISDGRNGTALRYCRDDIAVAAPALLAAATQPGQPVAAAPQSLSLLALGKRVAESSIPVLVQGPTGTGKEVFARYLHAMSARAQGPFIAVNCAAMPEAMLEALLFGHRKGAFTGASASGEGFFRAAHGGTLLLDEIGEMPLALQAKLLRALQEGEVVPLGATKPEQVDVRIVACTNRDLWNEVDQGRFREDLYYRLNVFPLHLPALRERTEDIAPLAFSMLLRHSAGPDQPRWISAEAIALLAAHSWPGNVRELENVIRRAILLSSGERVIGRQHIHFDKAVSSSPVRPSADCGKIIGFPSKSETTRQSLSDIAFESEAQAILDTLEECGGRRAETARRLGISERTLRYRLANMREAGLAMAGAGR